MRSTSMAIASIACSIRSSRAPTSFGSWFPDPLVPRSMRRARARAIGVPMMVAATQMNRTIGISSPGTPTGNLRCVDARDGQRESNLGPVTDRARGVNRTVVREDRLARDREPQPGSSWLVRHVWLPDAREALGRNAASGVADRDHDTIVAVAPLPRDRDADARGTIRLRCSPGPTRVDSVEQDVREGACERVMVPTDHWDVILDTHLRCDIWRHGHAGRIANELRDIHVGRRALRQASKLREAPGHLLETP